MDNALQGKLYDITDSERWHLEHPGLLSPVYDTVPYVDIDGTPTMLFNWEKSLGKHSISVIKESRFTTIPPHVNTDMELGFIHDGTCDFVVDGKALHLERGDVILFEPGVVRSSPQLKGYRDIVISIVFRREFFDSVFLSQLPTGGALTTLLFEYVSNRRRRERYLHVPAEFTGRTPELIRFLTEENRTDDSYTVGLQTSYVRALFLELMRGLAEKSHRDGNSLEPDEKTAEILDYLEHNYKSASLASVAKHFGYSPNYLGNLLRQKTGHSFSEIRLAQQMSEAAYLLLNTDKTIGQVAEKVGIGNMSYFYKKFDLTYGMRPKEYRTAARYSG